MKKIKLGKEHISVVNRKRRVVVNYDIAAGGAMGEAFTSGEFTIEQLISPYMRWLEEDGNQVDSIWYCWSEGTAAHYPSKYLPVWKGYKHWFDAGIDPCKSFIDETRKRGKEVFYSYRINGTDEDPENPWNCIISPMKKEHPDWVLIIQDVAEVEKYKWNFAAKGLREYKLNILREITEIYDIDGIEIDFARVTPVLPVGHQWEYRNHLTDFMRELRYTLLEIAEKRGHPLLLAVRIPELIEGCHFDGIDIKTWVEESLVDILTLGCRSLEVDLAQFRHLVAGTHIKLYPVYDLHHASDGYKLREPETRYTPYDHHKIMRGVFTNFWQQGADGIQTFNFPHMSSKYGESIGFTYEHPLREIIRMIYCEMGSMNDLLYKDKTFVVQRRAGGHPWFFGLPEQGKTQVQMYHNSNMLAALPAKLGIHANNMTIIRMYAGDDVNNNEHVKSIKLRLLLSDIYADTEADSETIEAGLIRQSPYKGGSDLYTTPLKKKDLSNMEIRLNNIILPLENIYMGWLVFSVNPEQLALGTNLVGVRLLSNEPSQISIEKMELDVEYQR